MNEELLNGDGGDGQMNYVTLLIALLLLAGCAQKMYTHSSKTAADFERDKYDCEITTTQHARMQGLDPMFAAPMEMDRCLKAKHGWYEMPAQRRNVSIEDAERQYTPPSQRGN